MKSLNKTFTIAMPCHVSDEDWHAAFARPKKLPLRCYKEDLDKYRIKGGFSHCPKCERLWKPWTANPWCCAYCWWHWHPFNEDPRPKEEE